MVRTLFVLDMKNYDPNGKVIRRPSVRAIIIKDGKILLIYSCKYDYYKFPGGGIAPGEDIVVALEREVKEETGFQIVRESIKEFGRVPRRQKDAKYDNFIFEQENFYYLCEIGEERQDTDLDDYEVEEGFTAVWVDPWMASRHNHYSNVNGRDPILIKREEKVLDIIDKELREKAWEAHEKDTVKSLGAPGYSEMLDFVKLQLCTDTTENIGAKMNISYSRFEHTKRVLGWSKRLYELSNIKDKLSYEDIIIAVIFHDVGRNVANVTSHAQAGVPITRKYLLEHGYESKRVEYICSLVDAHSDKQRMSEDDIDKGLLLLMEADLMDDMGALGIVMDCMITEKQNPNATFKDCLNHIERYTYREHKENPMVTLAARRIWDEKTELVSKFVDSLKEDIIL